MYLQFIAQSARENPQANLRLLYVTVYSSKQMIRILGTIFAGLLGLAFGSFLNVFVTRWPQGESVVKPRSHCRNCEHMLAWWENLPLLSWILLRGRCRQCKAWISVRYPIVELVLGALWGYVGWVALSGIAEADANSPGPVLLIVSVMGQMIFFWMIAALAALDAEHLWLPDLLTVPGIAFGFIFSVVVAMLARESNNASPAPLQVAEQRLIGIVVAAGMILLIRWIYWLVRKQEGIGLGDAKLMAMLAAWLGLPLALLAFAMSAFLGSFAAIALLAGPGVRSGKKDWATSKLPFGTFICIGGIISGLWGERMIAAYLHLAGF